MKNVLAALSLLIAVPASAWEKELLCITEFPTTSFELVKTEKELQVRVIHHNGTRFAPFWNGLIVPNDLPLLQSKASLIEKMDTRWKMSWPLEKCEFHEDLRFECMGGATAEASNGMKIEPFAIYTTRLTEDSIAGVYRSTIMTVTFDVNGVSQTVSMQYRDETNDCFEPTTTKPAKRSLRARLFGGNEHSL
jgi:hypothetical protein